jgi:hypothetical protein
VMGQGGSTNAQGGKSVSGQPSGSKFGKSHMSQEGKTKTVVDTRARIENVSSQKQESR